MKKKFLQTLHLQEEKDLTFKIPKPVTSTESTEKLEETTQLPPKEEQQTKFTIKTELDSFYPHDLLCTIINAQVRILSRMFILMSIFVNFDLDIPKILFF